MSYRVSPIASPVGTFGHTRELYARMNRVECWLVWAAIANFAALCVLSLALGGDALNGTIRNGHYYLGNHGNFTEVSKAVFEFSRVQTLSVFITHPMAIIASLTAFLRSRLQGDPEIQRQT
jgi:hypothetical protein